MSAGKVPSEQHPVDLTEIRGSPGKVRLVNITTAIVGCVYLSLAVALGQVETTRLSKSSDLSSHYMTCCLAVVFRRIWLTEVRSSHTTRSFTQGELCLVCPPNYYWSNNKWQWKGWAKGTLFHWEFWNGHFDKNKFYGLFWNIHQVYLGFIFLFCVSVPHSLLLVHGFPVPPFHALIGFSCHWFILIFSLIELYCLLPIKSWSGFDLWVVVYCETRL